MFLYRASGRSRPRTWFWWQSRVAWHRRGCGLRHLRWLPVARAVSGLRPPTGCSSVQHGWLPPASKDRPVWVRCFWPRLSQRRRSQAGNRCLLQLIVFANEVNSLMRRMRDVDLGVPEDNTGTLSRIEAACPQRSPCIGRCAARVARACSSIRGRRSPLAPMQEVSSVCEIVSTWRPTS